MKKPLFLVATLFVVAGIAVAQQTATSIEAPVSPLLDSSAEKTGIEKFDGPIAGYPPEDTPHTDTKDARFHGRLIYGSLGGVTPRADYYIVFQGIGKKFNIGEQDSDAIFYWNHGRDIRFHSPVISLDGQKMFFRYGNQFDANDIANSYKWGFLAKKLEYEPPLSIAQRVIWSGNNVDYLIYFQDRPPEEGWSAEEGYMQPMVMAAKLGDPVRIPLPVAARTPAWTRQNTVLCTSLPKATNAKPDIIEWKPFSKTVQVIAPAAFDPAPSPDGRFLAYFGWPSKVKGGNPAPVFLAPLTDALPSQSQPQAKPSDFDENGPFCFILDRQSGRKFLVNTQGKGLLSWSSDSQTLVAVESRTDGPGSHTALVRTLGIGQITGDLPPNVPHQLKEIAQIQGRDFQPLQRATPPWIRVMSAATHTDGQWLYFDVNEITGLVDFYAQRKRIIAVNVASGEQVVISEMNDPFGHVQGWDYHDDENQGFKATSVIQRPAALASKVKPKSGAKPKKTNRKTTKRRFHS